MASVPRPALIATALVSLACVGASLPALSGSWVYDDHHMRNNPAMDGPEDLWAAWWSTSDTYLDPEDTQPGAVTYRPLPMFSLVATQVVASARPWAHHLVSLALHLLCLFLLGRALALWREGGGLRWAAWVWFALHPVGAEAFGWINGRSDVLAGAALAGVAASLAPAPPGPRDARLGWLAAAGLAGTLSKITFLPALGGVLLAAALRHGGRRLRPALASVGLAVAVSLALRAWVIGAQPPLPLPSGPLARGAKLLALAAQGLMLPQGGSMRALVWELAQPAPALGWLCLAALGLGWLWLLWRRAFAAAALWGAAGATVLPALWVADAYWLGFDRYLYLPALLFALSASDLAGPRRPASSRGAHAALRAWGPAALLGAALATQLWVASGSYRDHQAWFRHMIAERPRDPTGRLIGARWLLDRGRVDEARALLAPVPLSGLPPALARETARVWRRLGEPAKVVAILEDSYRRAPDDPYVMLDVMGLRAAQGRLGESLELATRLGRRPGMCRATRAQLLAWIPQARGPARRQLERVLAALPCGARPGAVPPAP